MVSTLLNLIPSKKEHNKLIYIFLRFLADKGRDFSLVVRLLNVDKYYFPFHIIIETIIQVANNYEVYDTKTASFVKKYTFVINKKKT